MLKIVLHTKLILILLTFSNIVVLSGCGKKTALVLPDENKVQTQKTIPKKY